MKSIQHAFILLFISIILAACGGGGGGGDPAPNTGTQPSGNAGDATATAENSDELAIAAQEGSKQAISSSNNPFGSLVSENYLNEIVVKSAHETALSYSAGTLVGAVTTINGSCGGTASVDVDNTNTNYVITYSNYCYSSNYVIDGTITYTIDSNNNVYSYSFNNVTISYGGQTHTLNGSSTCNRTTNQCSYNTSFTGSNNVSYSSSNVSVSGNNNSGYNISATITHPTYGSISIVATNITICTNGNIGTGTISVTDSTGNVVISATFPSCSQMIITYNNVTTTVNQ